MCNNLYDYEKQGLLKTFQVFGAMVKVEQNLVEEVHEKILNAGYSINVDEETKNIQICFNGKFFELMKTCEINTVPFFTEHNSIYDAVKANQEWMIKGMGEGLIVTSDKTIHKWKIGAEQNTTNLRELDTVIQLLLNDMNFLAPKHNEALELLNIMRAIQVSPAMIKPANPNDEYQAAIKSAMTKFDAPDTFEYGQYVELIS